MQQGTSSSSTTASRRLGASVRQRMWMLGALLAAGSAALVLSLSAWAGPDGGERGFFQHGHHHAHMMGGHHGGMPFGFWGGRHVERILDRIDATPAQREQIRQILEKAKAESRALHQEGRALHDQGLQLWAQPQIDAAAAEQLRRQMLAHHDKVSQNMLRYAIEVGTVLTPAQRAQLAEDIQKRRDRMKARHAAAQAGASAASQPAPRK